MKSRSLICIAALAVAARVLAAEPPPEIGQMLERALEHTEALRKQWPTLQYDATMRVTEWDGRGRVRGTAKAVAVMRPGDPKPMTFVSREVHGKVRLPEENEQKDEDEKETTLQEFAREHRIAERYDFAVEGTEQIAGERAVRVRFTPKGDVPAKNRAERFLNRISGRAWVSEGENRLVKFQMQLDRPFQLFWIFAVLKELSIEYELLRREEILGPSNMRVVFALATPIYRIRQQHDVELRNFRRRENRVTAR